MDAAKIKDEPSTDDLVNPQQPSLLSVNTNLKLRKRISCSIPNLRFFYPPGPQSEEIRSSTNNIAKKSLYKTRKSISQKLNLSWYDASRPEYVEKPQPERKMSTSYNEEYISMHQYIKNKVCDFFKRFHTKAPSDVAETSSVSFKSGVVTRHVETREKTNNLEHEPRTVTAQETTYAVRTKEARFPKINDVLEWQNSFPALLGHPYGISLFSAFLKTEYSEENLEFWLACEKYKESPENQRESLAKDLYVKYLRMGAVNQVNLDTQTRAATVGNLERPDEHTFDLAQKRIYNLMEKDSYPRFIASEMYRNLLPKDLTVLTGI